MMSSKLESALVHLITSVATAIDTGMQMLKEDRETFDTKLRERAQQAAREIARSRPR